MGTARHIRQLAVVALVATACSAAAEPATTVTTIVAPGPSTAVSTTTTPPTTVTTTTPITTVVPPVIDNVSDDWETVWVSLMETRDWVGAHPERRDVLLDVFADDCPCLEEEFAFVDGLVELGLVSTQEPVELLGLTEVARPRDDRVILSIVMYRPPFSLVAADGSVYQSDLGDWTETLAVSLNNFDGRWLIQSLEVTDRVLGS